MTVNYSTILDHMVATAREAGALTLDHFRRFRDIEIGVKGPGISFPMRTGIPRH